MAPKVKINPGTVKARRRPAPKAPTIKNQHYDLIQKAIVKNIKPSKQQENLEKAIKNKDFEKYSAHLAVSSKQDERLRLDRVTQAITLLKQKFQEANSKVEQYDPNLDAVPKVEKQSSDMIKTLDNKFKELILIRQRLGNLSDADKRKFNNLDRDIERYSYDLEKVNALVKKLEGKPKLPSAQVERLRKIKESKKDTKQLTEAINDTFTFGTESTTREKDIIVDALKDDTNHSVAEDIVAQNMALLDPKIEKLQRQLVNIKSMRDIIYNDIKKFKQDKSAKEVNTALVTFEKTYKKVNALLSFFSKKVSVKSYKDIEKYIAKKDELDSLLESVKEMDEMLHNFIKYRKPNKPKEEINNLDFMINKTEEIVMSLKDMIYQLRIFSKYFTAALWEESEMKKGQKNTSIIAGSKKLSKKDAKHFGQVGDIKKGDFVLRNYITRYIEYTNDLIVDMERTKEKLIKILSSSRKEIKNGNIDAVINTLENQINYEFDTSDDDEAKYVFLEESFKLVEEFAAYVKDILDGHKLKLPDFKKKQVEKEEEEKRKAEADALKKAEEERLQQEAKEEAEREALSKQKTIEVLEAVANDPTEDKTTREIALQSLQSMGRKMKQAEAKEVDKQAVAALQAIGHPAVAPKGKKLTDIFSSPIRVATAPKKRPTPKLLKQSSPKPAKAKESIKRAFPVPKKAEPIEFSEPSTNPEFNSDEEEPFNFFAEDL